MIKVLIVDDHAVVRQGLKQILLEAGDIQISGEAAGYARALELVRSGGCDVAVVDISLPGKSGLELLRQARKEAPRLPVLILTIYSEEQFAVQAFRCGAAGYLTKDAAPDELVEAVRKVARGGRYVSPALGEKLAQHLSIRDDRPLHETLSSREYEVMRALASGRTVSQIAEDLKLSVKTVSTYRSRILAKMGMRTNAELMRYAFRNGFVQ
jgi:DNA-binding NarL/FixJ family response regulator